MRGGSNNEDMQSEANVYRYTRSAPEIRNVKQKDTGRARVLSTHTRPLRVSDLEGLHAGGLAMLC